MDYSLIIITASHIDLFERKIEQAQIIEELSKYPLHQLLDFLVKIDILLQLNVQGLEKFGGEQGRLASNILARSAVSRFLRRHPHTPGAFFSRGQLIILRKFAILNCTFQEKPTRIWDSLRAREVTEIMLGAHDLLNEEADLDQGADTEAILSFFLRTYYLNQNAELKQKLIRAYLMFIKAQEPIGEFPNLDGLFIETIGVTTTDIMSICFGLVSKFLQKREIIAKDPMVIVPEIFFSTLKLDKALVEKTLGLLSINLEELQSLLRKESIPLGYGTDVFGKTPLLVHEHEGQKRFYCMDILSLVDKFTVNLSWALGNRNEFSKALQEYKGKRFEIYLRYLLIKYCELKKEKGLEYLHIDDYGRNGDEELGDALVIDRKRKVVLIFEAKSRQLPREVKEFGDLHKLKENILGYAEQLDRSILGLKKEALIGRGFSSIDDYRFFPIVVSYETIPVNNALHRYFRDYCKEKKLLLSQNIMSLELLGVSTIEHIMEVEEDLISILLEKHSNVDGEEAALSDYATAKKFTFISPFLEKEGEEMFSLFEDTLKLPTLGMRSGTHEEGLESQFYEV